MVGHRVRGARLGEQSIAVHTPKADVQYTRQIDQTTEIIGKNAIGLSV